MARVNTPTMRRILREASELTTHPTPDIHARPLSDTNLFEWHFTLRGPPPPSPFSNGIYHGRISLPPSYPLRPPSFRFLTPTGRFEVNREICLSISGHHEETWQPAWGIRTALLAIRAFMDAPVEGALGGLECSEEGRRELAGRSRAWRCRECAAADGCGGAAGEAATNEEVLEGERRRWLEMGGGGATGAGAQEEKVPEELRLAYREDLAGGSAAPSGSGSVPPALTPTPTIPLPQEQSQPQPQVPVSASAPAPAPQIPPPQLRQRIPNAPPPPQPHLRQQNLQQQAQPQQTTNIDRLIIFLLFILGGLVWRKLGKVEVEFVY